MSGQARESGRVLVISALLGACLAVAVIPSARSTVTAEIVMALGRRPEWARAAAGGDWPRLQQTAAARPGDIALQIGLATLPPREAILTSDNEPPAWGDPEITIRRLEALERQFPSDAAIRAHLMRYMMVSRIRIDRPEEDEVVGHASSLVRRQPRQKPCSADLSPFLAAASDGARLEPKNAYFDAMRAAAEFAVDRDGAALRDWHAAAARPEWDDHANEETRAQWALLDAAYGEHGVIQKSPGVEHMLWPHFHELCHAAQLAVWHAARRERAGDGAAARSIRHDVMQLGMLIAHDSPSAVGKYVGLAIFGIGTSPVPPEPLLSGLTREAMLAARRARQQRYEKALQAEGEAAEADWVRAQRERGERLRSRLDLYRDRWEEATASQIAGRSAGISPEQWEGWWSFGILMLEQIGLLLALWGGAALLARLRETEPVSSAQPAAVGAVALAAALLVTAAVVTAAAPSFALTWASMDFDIAVRLAAALAVLLGIVGFVACRRERGGAAPGISRILLWVAALVAVCLVPALMWTATGSAALVPGSALAGVAALGALRLSSRAGRGGEKVEARPRWKPELVALLAIVPTATVLFLGRNLWSLSQGLATRLLVTPPVMGPVDPESDPGRVLPALLILPPLLLMLFQLCRVVALRLPLRSGMARGLRQTAPAAIGMLLALYLVALVPTIARDHAAAHRLDQMLVDTLSWTPGSH